MFHDNPTCPICQIGQLHLRLITYVHVYAGTLVSVPNTPAWECDVCHTVEYDTRARQRIETLVGQAGPPPNRHRLPAHKQLPAKSRAVPPKG